MASNLINYLKRNDHLLFYFLNRLKHLKLNCSILYCYQTLKWRLIMCGVDIISCVSLKYCKV